MTSLVLYGLAAIIGALAHRLIFGAEGPFEKTIIHSLVNGKRVIVAIDHNCYIFEMKDKRLRITRGEALFYDEEGEEDELNPFSVVRNDPDQSDNDSDPGI